MHEKKLVICHIHSPFTLGYWFFRRHICPNDNRHLDRKNKPAKSGNKDHSDRRKPDQHLLIITNQYRTTPLEW